MVTDAFYNSLLLHAADIYRTTNSTSSTGTVIRSFNLLYQSIECLIQPTARQLITIASGTKTPLTYRIFIKHDADVLEGDKVIWNRVEFLVVQCPPQDGSGHNHHRECIMEQL
jgi:SPP1 family predicted phage head-tail adaptor